MRDLIQLVGGVGALLAIPWLVFMLGVSVAFPFMVISVVKNVARMRRALERIADAGDTRPRPTSGGVLGI
jgi:hypothetical protein